MYTLCLGMRTLSSQKPHAAAGRTQESAVIDSQDVGTTNSSQHSLKVLSKLLEALTGRMVTDSIGAERQDNIWVWVHS